MKHPIHKSNILKTKNKSKTKYLNVCIWNPKVKIGDEELPSGFHTSSPAASSSAVEATEAVVKHVVLPFVWELFGLQQMKENAPADFRIPLPLSITVHKAGCWGKQGLRILQGQDVQLPQEGPQYFPAHPITTSKWVRSDRRTYTGQTNITKRTWCAPPIHIIIALILMSTTMYWDYIHSVTIAGLKLSIVTVRTHT